MMTPEFVAAEVAYRTERLTADYRDVRRQRKLRAYLRLPSWLGSERVRSRTLANG
jgi:hypothetical protein